MKRLKLMHQESASNLYIWNDMNEVRPLILHGTQLMIAIRVQRSRDHRPKRHFVLWRMGEQRYPQYQRNALRKLTNPRTLCYGHAAERTSTIRLLKLLSIEREHPRDHLCCPEHSLRVLNDLELSGTSR